MIVVDFDDFHETNHRLDLLGELRALNPAFRCTVFAIPALGSWKFWESVPNWIELAVHGWEHPTPTECQDWSYQRMLALLDMTIVRGSFARGFKAPGWQISDGCYQALVERDFWLADQPYNDERRPPSLRVHRLGDGNHWHGHIQNVCGNGLEERFDELKELVKTETDFRWVSEAAR